jgi:hypothetical protein
MGKEVDLTVCAFSWFLQKGRLVDSAYYSRIELSTRVILHDELCCVHVANAWKVRVPVEDVTVASSVTIFPFKKQYVHISR